uniref:Uncharacterized protein n=1 Tax=Spongospora subterranea TaxID=70186 RepID=A0A0H5R0U5_9EUKA|eukprot:CRZ01414.1 hypothetical protein [Spongospora subterranea]
MCDAEGDLPDREIGSEYALEASNENLNPTENLPDACLDSSDPISKDPAPSVDENGGDRLLYLQSHEKDLRDFIFDLLNSSSLSLEAVTTSTVCDMMAEALHCRKKLLRPMKSQIVSIATEYIESYMVNDESDASSIPKRKSRKPKQSLKSRRDAGDDSPNQKSTFVVKRSRLQRSDFDDDGVPTHHNRRQNQQRNTTANSASNKGVAIVKKRAKRRLSQAKNNSAEEGEDSSASEPRHTMKSIRPQSKNGVALSSTKRSTHHVMENFEHANVKLFREDVLFGKLTSRSTCVIQLLEHDEREEWVLYEEWGLEDERRKQSLTLLFSDPELAKKALHDRLQTRKLSDPRSLFSTQFAEVIPSTQPKKLVKPLLDFLVDSYEVQSMIENIGASSNVTTEDCALGLDRINKIKGELDSQAETDPNTWKSDIEQLRKLYPFIGQNVTSLEQCQVAISKMEVLHELLSTMDALSMHSKRHQPQPIWANIEGEAFAKMSSIISCSPLAASVPLVLDRLVAVALPGNDAQFYPFSVLPRRHLLWGPGIRMSNLYSLLSGGNITRDAKQFYETNCMKTADFQNTDFTALALYEVALGEPSQEFASKDEPNSPYAATEYVEFGVNQCEPLPIVKPCHTPDSITSSEGCCFTVIDSGQARLRYIAMIKKI